MAWQMRKTEISGEAQEEILDENGDPTGTFRTIDLTLEGRFRATVEYFDDAEPLTVLFTQTFDFGFGTTAQAADDQMKAVGVRVRDTRALVAAQQSGVGVDTPID
jgi:hypothetical protein